MSRNILIASYKTLNKILIPKFRNVTDVLSQEEYRKKYPDGTSHSPYVFICEDFHELEFKPQVSGQHKLWRLPRDIHQSARTQLHL